MKDLQIAIADYASEHSELEQSYQMRPSVETLPESGNNEGDVRLQTSDNSYYIYNEGWDKLPTGSDEIAEGFELATRDDVLAAIAAGKAKANG